MGCRATGPSAGALAVALGALAACGSSAGQGGGAVSGDAGSGEDGGGSSDAGAGRYCFADSGWIAPLPSLAAQYQGVFSAPPALIDTDATPDGPLLGNGDVGAVVLGTIDAMTFVLGKNEFWSLASSGRGAVGTVKAMARLSVSMPGMQGASYSMIEELGPGQVFGIFRLNANVVNTTSWVQATDTTNNLL